MQKIIELDNLIDRWYTLKKKQDIKKLGVRELAEYIECDKKIKLFKQGRKLKGFTLKEYLKLTGREWGDKCIIKGGE